MKILVTPTSFNKPQNIQAKTLIENYADEVVYNELGRPLSSKELVDRLEGVDGYIAGLDYINEEVLEKANQLKCISRYGAGVDRVDLQTARKKGIKITNTPGTNAVAVCELAFTLMLCLARSVPKLDKDVKGGAWPRNNGIELNEKTLGIVGFGAIGKNMAVRARAFNMNVIAYDPYFDTAFAKDYGVKSLSLDAVLRESDFMSLHVPLNNQTKHMINKKSIDHMKQGAFVINTARGGLIDEDAAARAIQSGKIGGMGLDVYEIEPVVESPLIGLDNVIMTPHTGAHTNEAIKAMGMMAVKNLIDVLEDIENPNIID